MDVNAIDVTGADGLRAELEVAAAENVKRVVAGKPDGQSLYEHLGVPRAEDGLAPDRRMSHFDHLREIVPQRIWPGLVGRSVHGAEATLAAIELEPNVDVPEHSHVNEQIGILTSGSLTFRIGGEEQELEAGATWLIPAHVPHSVRSGPEGATLIEVFSPPRDDWGGLERLDAGRPPRLPGRLVSP